MVLRCQTQFFDAREACCSPFIADVRISSLIEGGTPRRHVAALEKTTVDAVDNGLAVSSLVDEEWRNTQCHGFDRSQTESFAMSQANYCCSVAHDRAQGLRAKTIEHFNIDSTRLPISLQYSDFRCRTCTDYDQIEATAR